MLLLRLLLLTIPVARGFAADAFADIRILLQDTSYIQSIPAKFLQCLSLNQTESTDESCNRLFYIEKVHALHAAAVAKKEIVAPAGVVEVDSGDYAAQFENKIAKNIPYKGFVTSSKFSASTVLSTCIMEYGLKLNDRSKDIPVAECSKENANIFEGAVLPRIVANDYLPRWSPARQEHMDTGLLLDYQSHWPAFLPLYDVVPVVHQCPVGLHMVVWGAKESVKVRLFNFSSASHLLSPSLGLEIPHYFSYAESGFSPKLPRNAYLETNLEEGQFLFVPRTMVASFDSGASSGNNALLRSCFVDASNLKEVREHISMEAKVVASSRIWLGEIDRLSFQYALNRSPSESALLAGAGGEAAAAGESPAEKKPNRRARGSSMRDLGDAASWSFLVTSLTVPMPSAPRFSEVDLNSAVIEWTSHFAPSSIDKTVFGFNLSVCEASNRASCHVQDLSGPNLRGKASARDPSAQVFQTVLKKFLKPATDYIARVNMYYGTSVGYASDWSNIGSTKRILPPSMPGVVAATVSPKDSSTAVLTFQMPSSNGGSELTGYYIFAKELQKKHGFAELRELGFVTTTQAKVVGSEVTVIANHLSPGVKYSFSVSAANAAGTGPVSSLSNEVETPWLRGKDSPTVTLTGHTHEKHALPAGTPSFPLMADGEWSPSKRLIAIKSKEDSIILMDGEKKLLTIPTWGSHWNANIDVSAQAAWMDPVNGRGALNNGNDLQNKIAIAERGHVSFVHKARAAQMAGAMALIIIDDGKCRVFDQACVPGSSKAHDEGFASSDDEKVWASLRIPVYLVMKPDWLKLIGKWEESPAKEKERLEPEREIIRSTLKRQREEAEAIAAMKGEL